MLGSSCCPLGSPRALVVKWPPTPLPSRCFLPERSEAGVRKGVLWGGRAEFVQIIKFQQDGEKETPLMIPRALAHACPKECCPIHRIHIVLLCVEGDAGRFLPKLGWRCEDRMQARLHQGALVLVPLQHLCGSPMKPSLMNSSLPLLFNTWPIFVISGCSTYQFKTFPFSFQTSLVLK